MHAVLGVDDPQQLAWAHLCLVDSFLAAARGAGLAVSAADADRYVAEQRVTASLVGVRDDLVPAKVAELDAAVAAFRPALRCTAEARDAARLVLAPPMQLPMRWAVPARAVWTTAAGLAAGLLPGWALRMYRMPVLPGRSVATAVGLHVVRGAVHRLPAQYRESPLARQARERAESAAG